MGFKEDWGIDPVEAIVGAVKDKLKILPEKDRKEMEKKVRESVKVYPDKEKTEIDPELSPWENFKNTMDGEIGLNQNVIIYGIVFIIVILFLKD